MSWDYPQFWALCPIYNPIYYLTYKSPKLLTLHDIYYMLLNPNKRRSSTISHRPKFTMAELPNILILDLILFHNNEPIVNFLYCALYQTSFLSNSNDNLLLQLKTKLLTNVATLEDFFNYTKLRMCSIPIESLKSWTTLFTTPHSSNVTRIRSTLNAKSFIPTMSVTKNNALIKLKTLQISPIRTISPSCLKTYLKKYASLLMSIQSSATGSGTGCTFLFGGRCCVTSSFFTDAWICQGRYSLVSPNSIFAYTKGELDPPKSPSANSLQRRQDHLQIISLCLASKS